MKYFLLLTTIAFGFGFTNPTLEEGPVKWTFSTQKIDDSTAYFIAEVKIDKGWVVYGDAPFSIVDEGIPTIVVDGGNGKVGNCSIDGPVCLEFVFEDGKEMLEGGVSASKNAIIAYDQVFAMKVKKMDGKIQFKQKIKNTSNQKLEGYVNYMACNSEKCIPPKNVDFSVIFPK